MNRRGIMIVLAAVLMAACGEETRNGQLTLSGSAPLRIADKDGKTVDFYSGPLKVEFGADSGRKFTVKLEQDSRKAQFSGRIPDAGSWNFTVRGKDIGQPVDFTSKRDIQLYGPITRTWGTGGPCGWNGNYVTEEEWQKGNEDWNVSFADAGNGAAVGAFKSRREGESYLISSRNTWCRERHEHEPGRGRWDATSSKLDGIKELGVKFD